MKKKTQWNTKVQRDPNRIWKKKPNETLRFKKTPTEYEQKHNETLRFKKTPTEYEKNTMKH